MTNEELMLLALEEAKRSDEYIRCGVVIARNGEVIVKTYNKQRKTNNTTAHAEINAISEAGQKLEKKNLDDCVIYCTCEPCSMCLSAIVFAKIPKLFYGTSMKETFPDNLPITLSTEELLSHSEHTIEIVPEFMKADCSVLLRKS